MEKAFGLDLFERTAFGYRPTSNGTALIASAELVEAAASQMQRLAEELKRASQAEIRFSTSDVLADLVAGPAVAHFSRVHPEIRVTLHVDSRAVDLENGEADIALRAAPVLENPRLVVRKLMDTPWAFYASAIRTIGDPPPQNAGEVIRHPVATLEGRPASILQSQLPGANIRYVSNSMKAIVETIKTSECVGALPMMVGEAEPGLRRCFTLDLDSGGIWVVFHERLQSAPHIRSFVDHLTEFIRSWRQGSRSRATEI